MQQWEYLKLDLNDAPRRGDETTVLNRVGNEGWELVTVTSTGLAILKREIAQRAKSAGRKPVDTTAK